MKTRDCLRDMEESLVQAHRGRAPVELSGDFTHSVMAAIRREAAGNAGGARERTERFVERLAARFALGACGAAAVCGAYGFLLMRSMDVDMALASLSGGAILFNNPLTGF